MFKCVFRQFHLKYFDENFDENYLSTISTLIQQSDVTDSLGNFNIK